MNGRAFTKHEDAVILANPTLGPVALSKLLTGRSHQSCRTRREVLTRDYDLSPAGRAFSADELRMIAERPSGVTGPALANAMGRHRNVVTRKAVALGAPFVR